MPIREPEAPSPARPVSPILFLLGEFTLLVIAALVAASPGTTTAARGVLVALALLAASALLWHQMRWRGTQWLLRIGAAIVAALLLALVLEWLARTEVFIVRCCRGGTRPGTFWPLLFAWATALGLFTFALWGTTERWGTALRRWSLRSALWWVFALAWSATCAAVLVRNLSLGVLWASLVPLGKLALWLGIPLALLIAVLFVLSRRDHKRSLAIDAEFEAMPMAARTEALDLIEQRARAGEFQYLYTFVEGPTPAQALARVNGDPLARPDESWPDADLGKPAWFLLQLPLDVPRLGPVWQSRLVSVFLTQDYQTVVRSYDLVTQTDLVALPNPGRSAAPPEQALRRLAVPYVRVKPLDEDEDEDDIGGFDVERLPTQIAGLDALLRQYSASPAKLLARVLAGRTGPYFTEPSDEILVGGDPLLIQGEHDPDCAICGKRMRLLFQLGELSDSELLFGDGGVCYVYGCDDHPALCEAFIDSH